MVVMVTLLLSFARWEFDRLVVGELLTEYTFFRIISQSSDRKTFTFGFSTVVQASGPLLSTIDVRAPNSQFLSSAS